jgi:hypothetical protein
LGRIAGHGDQLAFQLRHGVILHLFGEILFAVSSYQLVLDALPERKLRIILGGLFLFLGLDFILILDLETRGRHWLSNGQHS